MIASVKFCDGGSKFGVGLVKDRIQRIASYFGGMPSSQSSLEGRNKVVKEDFDRTPREIIELLNEFRVY